jgi:hypothetical protein
MPPRLIAVQLVLREIYFSRTSTFNPHVNDSFQRVRIIFEILVMLHIITAFF